MYHPDLGGHIPCRWMSPNAGDSSSEVENDQVVYDAQCKVADRVRKNTPKEHHPLFKKKVVDPSSNFQTPKVRIYDLENPNRYKSKSRSNIIVCDIYDLNIDLLNAMPGFLKRIYRCARQAASVSSVMDAVTASAKDWAMGVNPNS